MFKTAKALAIGAAAAVAGLAGQAVETTGQLGGKFVTAAQAAEAVAKQLRGERDQQQRGTAGKADRLTARWRNLLMLDVRRYPKPGWSVKQGQRMARKRRNQLKNRRAHRG